MEANKERGIMNAVPSEISDCGLDHTTQVGLLCYLKVAEM